MTVDLERELDRLFQLPLAEFVVARNALADALKKSADPTGSARVKEIPKPSPSAWAVNQLYWRARPLFDALLEAGDTYRQAQQDVLRSRDTEALLVAERNRSIAVEETLRRIVRIFDQDGQPAPSPAMHRRIQTTLEALASYGSAHPSPMKGRLTTDLESPGFEALAPFASALPPPEAASDRDHREREARRAAAQQRLEEAENALLLARAELERVQARVVELETKAAEARCEWEEAAASLDSGEAARERK